MSKLSDTTFGYDHDLYMGCAPADPNELPETQPVEEDENTADEEAAVAAEMEFHATLAAEEAKVVKAAKAAAKTAKAVKAINKAAIATGFGEKKPKNFAPLSVSPDLKEERAVKPPPKIKPSAVIITAADMSSYLAGKASTKPFEDAKMSVVGTEFFFGRYTFLAPIFFSFSVFPKPANKKTKAQTEEAAVHKAAKVQAEEEGCRCIADPCRHMTKVPKMQSRDAEEFGTVAEQEAAIADEIAATMVAAGTVKPAKSKVAKMSAAPAEKSTRLLDLCRYVRLKKSMGKTLQDCDVYIGPKIDNDYWKFERSEWCPPFRVKDAKTVEEYKKWIIKQQLGPELVTLRGKVIGGWDEPGTLNYGTVLEDLVNMKEDL